MGFSYKKKSIIKLPIKNYKASLKNFLVLKSKKILKNIKFLIIELMTNLF